MVLLSKKSLLTLAAPLAAMGSFSPAIASSQDAETDAEGVDASHEIVCRRMRAATGSRAGSRSICKTALEWAEYDEDAQNTVRRQMRDPLTSENEDGLVTMDLERQRSIAKPF